jgi:hypothetical protein
VLEENPIEEVIKGEDGEVGFVGGLFAEVKGAEVSFVSFVSQLLDG